MRSECWKSHFRGPRFQNFPGEDTPGPPYLCEVLKLCISQSKRWIRPCFDVARELHSQFYDLPDLDTDILDKWEDDLTNDVYGIEEIVEEYIRSALKSNGETSGESAKNSPRAPRSRNFRKQHLKRHQARKRRHLKLAPLQHNMRKFKRFLCLQAI